MVDNKINLDIDQYEPSDSEDEYTPREKALLEKVRKNQQRHDESSEEEVLGLDADDSDEYSDEEDGDIDQFNDSEDEEDEDEGLPDVRAWGKKKHAYYETDFVDQDYATYSAKEEELAALELQEAKSIQQRLAKQLNESDFSLDVLAPAEDTTADDDESKLTTDFNKLSVREKQMLFKKDSPEFEGLVEDMHHHLEESQAVLLPFLDYCKQKNITGLPVLKFAKTLNNLYLNYGNNVAYYLILKAKRIPVRSHPVVKRLVQMRQLIEQLVQRYDKIVKPEIERLMADLKAGKEIEIVPLQSEVQPKKLRKLMRSFSGGDDEEQEPSDDDFLDEQPKQKRMKLDPSTSVEDSEDEEKEDEDDEQNGDEEVEPARRPINYQIAKNKGLTPHKYRSDQRNPRVRNRKRYLKAVKRRKGAVKTARTEIPKYEGEKTGIKAYLKRSINIK